MHYIKTVDFDEFTCIAGDCPASCCTGWQIGIDEDSLLRYSRYEGGFGNYLRNSIDWEKGCFLQYDGRCALLNEDNLCDLQLEKGEEALCCTCDQHPRHVEEFQGVREYLLDLSCPEAAARCCGSMEQVEFLEYDDDEEDEVFEDFDPALYEQLVRARERIYLIIRDHDETLLCRMKTLLGYAEKLQQKYDETGSADVSDDDGWGPDCMTTLPNEMEAPFEIFSEMEHLNDEFPEIIEESSRVLSGSGSDLLLLTEEESRVGENLLILLIYNYFCGSVYDELIYSKAAAAVFMVIWILMINRAVGEKYQGLAGITYRLCREIEHTGDNFERLEDCILRASE